MGSTEHKNENTFMGRYVKRGNGWGVTLPPELRQRMGFIRGDYVVMYLVGDVLRLQRLRPSQILRGEFIADEKQNTSEVKGGS